MASAWAGVNSASVSGRATACVSSIASPIIARTRGRRVDRGPDPRFPEGDWGCRRRGRDAPHYRGDPSTGVGADGWAEMERGPSAPSLPLAAEVIGQSAADLATGGAPEPRPRVRTRLFAGADGASATALQPPPHLLTTLPRTGCGRTGRPPAAPRARGASARCARRRRARAGGSPTRALPRNARLGRVGRRRAQRSGG